MRLAEEMRKLKRQMEERQATDRLVTIGEISRALQMLLQDAAERREGRTPDSGMTFSVSVQCRDCKAVIRFENEKPEWKDLSEEIEAAHKWVEENPNCDLDDSTPRFVGRNFFSGKTFVYEPEYTRYIECPACGGEAPLGSGPNKGDADDR